jgi:hypothetical protein
LKPRFSRVTEDVFRIHFDAMLCIYSGDVVRLYGDALRLSLRTALSTQDLVHEGDEETGTGQAHDKYEGFQRTSSKGSVSHESWGGGLSEIKGKLEKTRADKSHKQVCECVCASLRV